MVSSSSSSSLQQSTLRFLVSTIMWLTIRIAVVKGQSSCSAGYYYNYDYSYCQYCPSGKYNPNSGSTSSSACINCASGTYSYSGASSCDSCPAGRYGPSTGSSYCNYCTSGKYNPNSGATSSSACTNCAAGHYSSSYSASTSCLPCPAGSYSSGGSSTCTDCPSGRYNSDTGSTSKSECNDCSVGTYSYSGASACTSCSSGQYNSKTGQSSCTSCAQGKYSADTGSVSCTSCSAGTYQSSIGRSYCADCESGQYGPNTGVSSCIDCPAGTYNPYLGSISSSACTDCSAGSYSLSGWTVCYTCSSGQYGVSSGASSCTVCDAGKYNPNSGSTSSSDCNDCPVGTFSYDGYSNCLYCGVGRYNPSTGASVCEACSAGTYNPNTGSVSSSECTECAAGRYASSTASSSCSQCASGTYGPSTAAVSCLDCPAGKSSFYGQTTCLNCTAGQYADSAGSSDCTGCTPGQYQIYEGRPSCVNCPAGRYNSYYYSTTESDCLYCGIATYSTAGQAGCTTCPSGTYQNETGQGECDKCAKGTASARVGQNSSSTCKYCKSGTVSRGYGWDKCNICFVPKHCLGGYKCADGYGGDYCSVCKDGWFQFNNRCQKCPKYGGQLYLIACMVAALFCYFVFQGVSKTDHDTSKMKLVITHFQLTAISFSFNLEFPIAFLKVVQMILSVFSFDFLQLAGPECSLGHALKYQDRWAISIFAPVMLMFPFVVIYNLIPSRKDDCAATIGVIASTTFIWGILTSMEVWACTDHKDGITRLDTDPDVICKSGDPVYDGLLAGSIFSFLFYFVFVQLVLLGMVEDKGDVVSDKLAGEFNHRGWFVVMNMVKFFAVIALLYMRTNPMGQAIMMLTVLSAYVFHISQMEPYAEPINNNLDISFRINEIAQLSIGIMHYRQQISSHTCTVLLSICFTISCVESLFALAVQRSRNNVVKEKQLELQLRGTKV